ncbi:hypothetical protein ACSZMV_00310 [Aeromonas veronii]
MKEATVIIDALLDKLRSMPALALEGQVCDSDPQIDQYTPLPLAHLREQSELALSDEGGSGNAAE